MKTFLSLSLLIAITCHSPVISQEVNTSSLLDELTDLKRLSELAKPEYEVINFSSYDRQSDNKWKDQRGWYSNSDGFGKERIPNFVGVIEPADKDGKGKFVICDVQGPGAIVREWTAAFNGEITVILDHQETPLYQGSAEYFFKHAYDAILNIPDPSHQNTLSQEVSGYYPIPFSKHCRIEWSGNLNEIHFYILQIRKYSDDARVETLTPDLIRENLVKIEKLKEILADPGKIEPALDSETALISNVKIRAGNSRELIKINGTGAIQQISFKIEAADVAKALRRNILRIAFDDFVWGQVQSPIGDFFSTAIGIDPLNSLPFTVSKDSVLTCRFVMPYKETAIIYIDNLSDQDIVIDGSVVTAPYQWIEGVTMYFHASWRINHELTANTKSPIDLVCLMAHGRGRYVGTSVFLKNPAEGPHNWGSWWGEGDEKIYIDDNNLASPNSQVRFPVVFGTGTEDYFGYAWSASDLFDHAYIGQPRNDGPGNRGFVTNYRFHIIDDFTFNDHISFFMELFPHDSVPDFTYGRIAYYYGIPGTYDDHQVISRDDVKMPVMPETWKPKAFGGSSGFMFHEAESILSGRKYTLIEEKYLWSEGKVMIWNPEKEGDKISFELPASSKGENMEIRLTVKKSPDGGSFSARINGEEMNNGKVYNLSDDYQTTSVNLYFVPTTKRKNKNQLELTFKGEKGQEIGIDFIWIKVY